jgi:threonine dehydrogenase-like Zn-dependent dehydrogenase
LTLGIDRLPGGFSPWILAPLGNVIEIPKAIGPDLSVLTEPFAAALHATQRIDLEGATRVAVLGVGRLGLLIVAALNVTREAVGGAFAIEAIDRYVERLKIAQSLGADTTWSDAAPIMPTPGSTPPFEIVIESTGSPQGLQTALSLASREVHVKSTTGIETLGFKNLTACVVDEVSLGCFEPQRITRAPEPRDSAASALVLGTRIPEETDAILGEAGYRVVRMKSINDLSGQSWRELVSKELQADCVVVDSMEAADRVIRPWPDQEQGLVRPRGIVLLADVGQVRSGLGGPILDRRIRLSTSRCGDFRKAIPSMERLLTTRVPLERIITDRLPVEELPRAFELARSPRSLKVVVVHTEAEGS